jgi:hypothetical protein
VNYAEFLAAKATVAEVDGFDVDVHPPLGWNERPTREWLEHAYVVRERGCPDIGRELHRDASTIRLWLKEAGIPTRPRGTTRESAANRRRGQGALRGRGHTPESIEKIRAATVADGRVPYLRDGEHWLKGAAPDANPNWKGGATPERQAFYRSAEWKAACVAVWKRADACCERCGLDQREVRGEQTFHIHHVVGFHVQELWAVVSNLRLLCLGCHQWVHSRANETGELLG